jgi:hypothetical protein
MPNQSAISIVNGYNYSTLDSKTRQNVIKHAEAIKFRTQRVIQDILEIGKSLVEVKAQLPHGQFGVWLNAEFGWSDQTALNFMNVAKRFPEIPNGLEFAPKALYLLSAKNVSDDIRQEALGMAAEGVFISAKVAANLINRRHEVIEKAKQIPNGLEFLKSELEKIKLSPIDKKLVQGLVNRGHSERDAEEIVKSSRYDLRKESAERKAIREANKPLREMKKPTPRITPKLKDELAELKEIADLKGEPLEQFLGGIIKNYRKKYK